MSKTWRQRVGRTLRDLATWIDPPSKPGRKARKARTECAHERVTQNSGNDHCSPMCLDCGKYLPFEVVPEAPLLHGWSEEPRV
jgi:hypothetical protein